MLTWGLYCFFVSLKIHIKFMFFVFLILSSLLMAISGYLFNIPAPIAFTKYNNENIAIVAEQPLTDYSFVFMEVPSRYFAYWTKISNQFNIRKDSNISSFNMKTSNEPHRVIFTIENTNIECQPTQETTSEMLENCHEVKN